MISSGKILIRFHLVSDGFSEFDGFYFDDLQVVDVNNTGVGINQTERPPHYSYLRLFPIRLPVLPV